MTTRMVAFGFALLFCGCASRSAAPVETLGSGLQDVSRLALTSLQGTRDGDRLDVRATYGDGSSTLRVDLQFRVTPPTRLQSGTWTGLAGQGTVQERSVTFLGGQSAMPSIGGRFDLIGQDERPMYRINIPVQELKEPLLPR